MDDLFLIGRIIFGGFFLYNGANHLLSTATMTPYVASKGVPMPEAAIVLTGLLLLVGGLSILLGLWPHVGALCIVVFLVGVTPVMHNFWADTDPTARMGNLANFTKNVALLGGALMTLAIPRPWPYSVERRRTTVRA